MTRDDIPPDLEEEILSRVPAKTLSRFRSTCKRWNNLFKDEKFTETHLDRAPKQLLVLMLNEHKVSSLRFSLQYGIDNNYTASPSIASITELDLNESLASTEKVYILRVFHCDGLLLCTTEKDRLVVWNPCTGETKCIEPSTNRYNKPGISYERDSTFALGYGNNRSYKILRYRNTLRYPNNSILRGRYCNNYRETLHLRVEFEIYEFSSGSWRFLEITANFIIRSRGVSLKGYTYWITDDNFLLSFDSSTEKIERMCLPFQDNKCSCTSALSTAKDEQLSLLHQRFDTLKLEIWVTSIDKSDDQDTVLSWRKFIAIDVSKLDSFHHFSSSVSFFIDKEMKVVVCCDVGRGRVHDQTINRSVISVIGDHCGEIHIGESLCKTSQRFFSDYVPSLVRIQ